MRLLLKGLLLITIVLIFGNSLLADVGYILIRYHQVAIETSLLIAVLAGISFLLIIFSFIRHLPNRKPTRKNHRSIKKPTDNFHEQLQQELEKKNWLTLEKLLRRHRKKYPLEAAIRQPFLQKLYDQRLTESFRTHTNSNILIADWKALPNELLNDSTWSTARLHQYPPAVTDELFPWLFKQTQKPDYLLAWAKHSTQNSSLRTEIIRAAKPTPISAIALGLTLESNGDSQGAQLAYEQSLLMQPTQAAFVALGELLSKQEHFDKATECYQKAFKLI